MKRIYVFPLVFLLSVFVYGCNEDVKENQIDFDLIASEETLPSDYDSSETNIEKIGDQSEFEEIWTRYRLEDKIPNIPFYEKGLYFIGVSESGSCPYTIKNIITSKNEKNLIVSMSSPDGDCTSDLTPRTFVIQIEKSTFKKIDDIKIIK